jgi:hypothetical protein
MTLLYISDHTAQDGKAERGARSDSELETLQRFRKNATPAHISSEYAYTTYPGGKVTTSVSIIHTFLIVSIELNCFKDAVYSRYTLLRWHNSNTL